MVYSWLTVGMHLAPAYVSRGCEFELSVSLAERLQLQLVANCKLSDYTNCKRLQSWGSSAVQFTGRPPIKLGNVLREASALAIKMALGRV